MSSVAARNAYITVALAYLGVAVIAPLAAEPAQGRLWLAIAQGFLMPVLLIWAIWPLDAREHESAHESARRWLPRRTIIGLALAIGFSFVGDMAPKFAPESLSFVAMVAGFFVAQLAWIWTLWPARKACILFTDKRWWALGYVAIAIVIVAVCLPGAGVLAPLLPMYAGALLVTGVLATSLGWRGTIGGLSFIASDGMIALFTFVPASAPGAPWRDIVIMSTYTLAQGLLVAGVRARTRDKSERDFDATTGRESSTS